MISKELLSEVLGGNYIHMKDNTSLNPRGIDIVYCEDRGFGGTVRARAINIYELAHKCKEWALTNNYSIVSHIRNEYEKRKDKIKLCRAKIHRDSDFIQIGYEYFYGDTEPEAIFKACEWILEQKSRR